MSAEFPVQGRIAGIDYGTVRIGIAICDRDQTVATPYENYRRGDEATDAGRFQRLVEEEEIQGFVVGLPVHASGAESRKSAESRRFGKWLSDVTRRPVVFHDERFSSVIAQQSLSEAGLSKKKRQKRLDMIAAQIMLASFLESSRRTWEPSRSLDDARGENEG